MKKNNHDMTKPMHLFCNECGTLIYTDDETQITECQHHPFGTKEAVEYFKHGLMCAVCMGQGEEETLLLNVAGGQEPTVMAMCPSCDGTGKITPSLDMRMLALYLRSERLDVK